MGTDGAPASTGIQVRVTGTFKRLQIILVPTGQIRRHRQELEISPPSGVARSAAASQR